MPMAMNDPKRSFIGEAERHTQRAGDMFHRISKADLASFIIARRQN